MLMQVTHRLASPAQRLALTSLFCTCWVSVSATAFQNLGFEAANTNNISVVGEGSVHDLIPGWDYNQGGSGYSVNWTCYINAPVDLGNAGQVSLITANNPYGVPVVGKYGIYFNSAYAGTLLPSSIRQTGTIPAGTKSLLFLDYYTYATGLGPDPFVEARINGSLVPLYNSLVGVRPLQTFPQWSIFTFESFADVSAYAGQPVTLEFTVPHDAMGLDDIQFSPLAVVPEPATWALWSVGLAGLWLAGRRRLVSQQGSRR